MILKKNNDISKYNQEQILTFYDELNENDREELCNDINKIDFKLMNDLYINSYKDEPVNINNYSPCKYINKCELDDISDSINLIKNNEYAIIIMAGGNGSRLGYDGPKGCVKVGNRSLFQIYIDKLLDIYKKYGVYINLYIMTSSINNEATIKHFEDNNYFGYKKKNINFFVQGELPILDKEGKILLSSKNHILFGPNGNGDVFNSLKKNGLLNDIKMKNIKYILFMGIDNPLTNLVDFNLLEIMIKEKCGLVSKTILKKDVSDKSGVLCKYNGKPAAITTDDVSDDISNVKINDEYAFRDKNILYHVISFDNLYKCCNVKLRYHRAYKKNNYMDLNGNYVIVNEPNSFKFEHFIFDAFSHLDDMLLYRVDDTEFLPIKNKDDLEKANKYFDN